MSQMSLTLWTDQQNDEAVLLSQNGPASATKTTLRKNSTKKGGVRRGRLGRKSAPLSPAGSTHNRNEYMLSSIPEPYQPRPYQLQAVKDGIKSLEESGNAVLVLATGTGKTEIMGWVYQHIRENALSAGQRPRALLVAHTDELIHQPMDKWRNNVFPREFYTGQITIGGVKASELVDFDCEVVCASIQTLHRSPKKIDQILEHGDITVIFTDECHRAVAPQNMAVYDYITKRCPNVWHLGVTATPRRHDETCLSIVFPSIKDEETNKIKYAYVYPMRKAIEEGYLSKLEQVMIKGLTVDLSKVKYSATGDADKKAMWDLYKLGNWSELLYQAWKDYAYMKPTIAFMPSVDIAIALVKDWGQKFGIPGGIVSSKGSWFWSGSAGEMIQLKGSKGRRKIVKMYKEGELTLLTNQVVFIEGFDAPTHCIIMGNPTESEGRWVQMLGRGTRITPGKERCIILQVDFEGHPIPSFENVIAGVSKPKDHESLEDRLARLSGYKVGEGVKKDIGCPSCASELEKKEGDIWWCPVCMQVVRFHQQGMFDMENIEQVLYDQSSPTGKSYYAVSLKLFDQSKAAWYTHPTLRQFSLGLGATPKDNINIDKALFITPEDDQQYVLLSVYRKSRDWRRNGKCIRCQKEVKPDDEGLVEFAPWECPYCRFVAYDSWQVHSGQRSRDIEELFELAESKRYEHEVPILTDKRQGWRYDKANTGQLNALKKFGVKIPPQITKGLAAQMLTHESIRKDLKRQFRHVQ